jgi:hypothetical protein
MSKLPSLPPAREVDHAIDLMLHAKSISRTPYGFSFLKYEGLEQ